MPNTGKPSRDCHLCRARRVKCDLNPSGCLRCEKIGKKCPGFRNEQDLLFRNETKVTFPLTHVRTRRPRNTSPKRDICKSQAPKSGVAASLLPLESDICRTFSPSPLPKIVEHWETYCIPVILQQFSASTASDRFYGNLDFLPDLYKGTKEDSCLSLATTAVARTYMTNLAHETTDRKELARTYGKALRAINTALESPEERVQDETIVSVWLLGIHEILAGSLNRLQKFAPEAPDAWHAHAKGLASLLEARGTLNFSTERGRNLFWMIYIFVQTRALVANEECPSQSLEWFKLLQPHFSPGDHLGFSAFNCNYQIARLCSQITTFYQIPFDEHKKPMQLFSHFLSEADTITNEFLTLTMLSPITDLISLHIHNVFLAAQIKLQTVLIFLLDYISPHTQAHPEFNAATLISRRLSCTSIINILSSEILSKIPVAVGDGDTSNVQVQVRGCWADGLRLLWPLFVVTWVRQGLRQHREKAHAALQRIGRRMGIKLALEIEPPAERFINCETVY